MALAVIFYFGAEILEVRVDGNQTLFRNKETGMSFAPIEGLHLDKKGVIKEFPELAEEENWREIAMQRLKEKISSYDTEDKKMEYIMKELKRKGYIPRYKQKTGFRVQAIK